MGCLETATTAGHDALRRRLEAYGVNGLVAYIQWQGDRIPIHEERINEATEMISDIERRIEMAREILRRKSLSEGGQP